MRSQTGQGRLQTGQGRLQTACSPVLNGNSVASLPPKSVPAGLRFLAAFFVGCRVAGAMELVRCTVL